MPLTLLDALDRIGAINRSALGFAALTRVRVVAGLCAVIAVMMPALFFTGLAFAAPAPGLVLVAAIFGAHLVALRLVRRGQVDLAAWLLCLSMVASQVFGGVHRDGLGVLLNPVLLVAPSLATYLLGARRGLWFSALALGEVAAGFTLHAHGWVIATPLFPVQREALLAQIAIQGVVGLAVVGWVHSSSQARADAALRAAHATLQKSEANLLSLIDNSRDMVVLLDLELQIVRANVAMRSFVAHHFNRTIDSGDSVFEALVPGRQPVWRERFARALAGGALAFDDELPTLVGRCCLEHHLDPVLGADGRALGLTLFSRDVTARKEAEARLQSAQTQLRNVEKLQAMGTLSAGIAHELNNPLSVVIANLDCLKDALDSGPPSEVFELRDEASLAAARIKQIVSGIRAFSGSPDSRPMAVDVERAIRRSVKIAEGELKDHGVLVLELHEVPRVLASEDGLVQVLLNVLVNAAQALTGESGTRGRVRVSTHQANDGRVIIEVEDNGAGMPPEVRDRVFEPFFTTRPIGQGKGLGLPICHGIVASLGGEIAVESEVGKGTVIRLLLPPVPSAIA